MITKEEAYKKYGDMNTANSYINWEGVETALKGKEWIPEFSEFKFNPNKLDQSFSFIKKSNTWYPTPDTFLDIKKKCGIEIIPVTNTDPEIVEFRKEEININIMHCISELKEPCMRFKAISVKVTKAGRCREGDGTFAVSGPCSAEHNFYDKVFALWVKNPKDYNTAQKRLISYVQTKEHALAIAQTKARNAVITVLAGLKKGFTTEDLQSGCFGFVKFVRSQQYQKMYTMAHVDAIRQGKTGELDKITADIMGSQEKIEAPIGGDFDTNPPLQPPPMQPKKKKKNLFKKFKPQTNENEKENLKNILSEYIKKGHNRAILAKEENAIDSIEHTIKNCENESIETLENIINIIESIPGIKKIETGGIIQNNQDNNDEEAGLF